MKTLLLLPLLGLLGVAGCTSCEPTPADGPGPECRAGTVGCPCNDTRCDSGLSCEAGTCRGVLTSGLKVTDPLARSCEVLVKDTGGRFSEVVFSGAVTGRVIREGDKTAIAFHANTDASIGGDAVEVAFTGQVERIDQALELTSARCFDASGTALAGTALSF